jgi:phage baseplate assembly protein W
MSNFKQYYDIKFPFTCNNLEGFFIDLNKNITDKKESEILHVLLTPRKTRIRKPDFGTDLIKYIFEPSDDLTWENVHEEIIESVQKYVSNVEINNIEIKDLEKQLFVSIKYVFITGKKRENKEMVVKL